MSLPESLRGELESYIERVRTLLQRLDLDAIEETIALLHEAYIEDRAVLVIGNGGSACTATHLCEDLATYTIPFEHPKRLRVLSLTDNTAMVTALGNDIDFDAVFSEQVQTYGRSGDLLIAMSGSGNSPNIIAAVERAQALGMRVVGMTGFGGGRLRELSDVSLHSPIDEMQVAQDGHMVMTHLLIEGLRARVQADLAAARATGG